MKRLLATCVVGLLVVGTANAQVRIFLDPVGVGVREARVAESGYGNPEVAQNTLTRLYIYGEFLGENDLWLAANFDMDIEGAGTLSSPTWYNHRNGNGPRWSSSSGAMNGATAEFRSAWIGNPNQIPNGMWNWDEAFATARTGDPFNAADTADEDHYVRAWDSQGGGLGTTLLGYVEVEGAGPADIFMTVQAPIFARLGATPDDFVHFGYGDDPVGTGEIGVQTTIADATIVPEPASLMLLSLGALALRRRR